MFLYGYFTRCKILPGAELIPSEPLIDILLSILLHPLLFCTSLPIAPCFLFLH